MEQQIKKVVLLLEEKKLIFEEYEAVTDALAEVDDTEVMEDYITKRSELANKIDAVDEIVKKLLTEACGDEGKRVLEASTERESLAEELHQVYDNNQNILEVARRIRLKNADITADYSRLRAELSEKIKATSNMPKINRYLNNLSSPEEINNFGSV